MLNVNDQKILNERMNSLLFDSFLDSSTLNGANETNSFESSISPLSQPPSQQPRPVEQNNSQSNLEFVDFIEVNNDLYNLLKEAVLKINRDGLILVEENISNENEVEIVEGIEIDKGFASSYFVTDLKSEF